MSTTSRYLFRQILKTTLVTNVFFFYFSIVSYMIVNRKHMLCGIVPKTHLSAQADFYFMPAADKWN